MLRTMTVKLPSEYVVRLRHRTLIKGHVWAPAHSKDVESVEISNPSANTDGRNAHLATGDQGAVWSCIRKH